MPFQKVTKLEKIEKESVLNISAIIKKYMGRDITEHDIHIQFIGTYEGLEGDSASISVITAVISAQLLGPGSNALNEGNFLWSFMIFRSNKMTFAWATGTN